MGFNFAGARVLSRIGLVLIIAYAGFFGAVAWTLEEPLDGPAAFASMAVGFLLLGTYVLGRVVSWQARRRREAMARGFPVVQDHVRDRSSDSC